MARRLLITGGTVLDGTVSALPTTADVLIEGDRIARVAPGISAEDAHALDATGLTVTPGFWDAHAHSDLHAFLDPAAQGRVHDGVTSEISGTCGVSYFPIAGPIGEERRDAMLKEGLDLDWEDATGYFDALERTGTAINRGFLTGLGTVRGAVLGFDPRPATGDEIRKMRELLAESLAQGSVGMSSGLCYPPDCYATIAEINTLCETLAETGRPYCTHMRSEGSGLLEALQESIEVCRETGAPLHISHVKAMGRANWQKIDALEEMLFSERDAGMDLTADRYPYIAAMTALFSMLPDWLMAGGRERALKRLNDGRERKKLALGLLERRQGQVRWADIRIGHAEGDMGRFDGSSMDRVAEKLGMPPMEALFEMLLQSNLNCSAIFFDMKEENLERILKWPFVCIGSDSAARALAGPTARGKPHPRALGTSARFLGEYVRERKLMPLPEAIARLTSLPAQRYGFTDRGVLREGAYADVVVFDPDAVADRATYEEPFQLSTGIRHVLVNGVPVLQDGQQTAALPGCVLRA